MFDKVLNTPEKLLVLPKNMKYFEIFYMKYFPKIWALYEFRITDSIMRDSFNKMFHFYTPWKSPGVQKWNITAIWVKSNSN